MSLQILHDVFLSQVRPVIDQVVRSVSVLSAELLVEVEQDPLPIAGLHRIFRQDAPRSEHVIHFSVISVRVAPIAVPEVLVATNRAGTLRD